MDDERTLSTAPSISTTATKSLSTSSVSEKRTSGGTAMSSEEGANRGGNNNMETRRNIPTNADHAENKASRSSGETSIGETTPKAVSGQSNTTTTTRASAEEAPTTTNNSASTTAAKSDRAEGGNVNTLSEKHGGNEHQEGEGEGAVKSSSSPIDPLKESTNTLASSQQQATTTRVVDEPGTVISDIDKSSCNASNDTQVVTSKTVVVPSSGGGAGEQVGGESKGGIQCSSKPPVPNFRVEGSGTGDSSITVAVASLSSAVSASVTLHSSGGRGGGGGGSTGGSNSLENGDQPGSSSGPVSIQSSEEMRLSLVSWYSEPEDPSRLIEGCCSALNTYRSENGVVSEEVGRVCIVDDRDLCRSSSSMGHDAIMASSASPVCKSESEEKENQTPEPCPGGNHHDKMNGSGGGGEDSRENNDSTVPNNFSKAELNNLNNSNNNAKILSSCSDQVSGSVTSHSEESQHCHQSNQRSGSGGNSSAVKLSRSSTSPSGKGVVDPKSAKQANSSSQKIKGHHVQMSELKQSSGCGGGHTSKCQQDGLGKTTKPECPRCSRRSKSGTTTPASGSLVARTRTPASRRVIQSSKSSTEIKKPIKSILKHDSRGSAGSGSGSDKQSSMDSLGSSGDIGVTPVHVLRGRMSNVLMTRSDSGTRARFNFNNANEPDTPTTAPEDRVVSKLKRIEKYATLRVRKPLKARTLELSDSEVQGGCCENHQNVMSSSSSSHQGGKAGMPGTPNELMSKSMSYLEKSSNRVNISSAQGHPYGESTSASSTLKRQGSLRLKKNATPQWEPSGTRTSALRLQKMQAAKAKNSSGGGVGGGGGASSGSANSGSAHSGSGDSLHYLPHSANSASGGGSCGMSSIHLAGAHGMPHGRLSASAVAKEKHMGAKIFSKLSSALGQTASSNQKRIKQERGIQTEYVTIGPVTSTTTSSYDPRTSLSPTPGHEAPGAEATEQIKNLERLCNRYRHQVLKIQNDFDKSESRKVELQKQLEEAQQESNEMIDFLQAEKSTLAESLTEVEVEAKKWKDEIESVKKDYQSRCSSLVRLSEQHKQEALKSQALLHRLESQSTSVISQLSHQITDGAQSVHQTRQRVTALTDSLLKTYKVPAELLASSETNQAIKEADLSCSLLLPLITSLSAAFPMVPLETIAPTYGASTTTGSSTSASNSGLPTTSSSSSEKHGVSAKVADNSTSQQSTSLTLTESSSLQSLNQAILEREAAEKSGIDEVMKPFSLFEGVSPDADQLSLRKEITELNAAIAKLLNVVRVIVIHCDRKVSSVASSILQCLKSIEDDKVGNMAEIAQVQKSLEAWSDKGMSGGTTSTTTNGSPPCKTTLTSTTVGGSPPKYLVGNGHAHV